MSFSFFFSDVWRTKFRYLCTNPGSKSKKTNRLKHLNKVELKLNLNFVTRQRVPLFHFGNANQLELQVQEEEKEAQGCNMPEDYYFLIHTMSQVGVY